MSQAVGENGEIFLQIRGKTTLFYDTIETGEGRMKPMKRKWLLLTLVVVLILELAAAAGIIYKTRLQGSGEEEGGAVAKAHSALAAAGASDDAQEAAGKETEESEELKLNGLIVAIDPGHQGPHVDMSAKEENGPGSGEMKAKATGGTTGAYTDLPEYQLNLDVALKVRDLLEERGYQVVMAREDNDTAISNKERAHLANEAGADVCVRIHANGSEDPSVQGALCLVMSPDNPYAGQLYEESNRLAESVLAAYCDATGFANQGVVTNDTMTGLNWSEIPVMILEMGFMTNEHDDTKMADAAFQDVMAKSIADGIDAYFGQ